MNKYPDLSIDECEKIRKKYLQDKKSNNSNYLEYYIKNFPNNTLEENKELLNKHIWESDYNNNPEKEIKRCIKFLQS